MPGEAWSHQHPLWVGPDLPTPSCVKRGLCRDSFGQRTGSTCTVPGTREPPLSKDLSPLVVCSVLAH